jgi:hypothetical protein
VLGDTTAMRIRSAAQGYVKVRGRAAPAHPEPTRAPLSGRPCVWWSYEIARDESERPGKSDWRTQEQATSVELFMLIDEDEARCLVGPVGAEITPTTRSVWYGEEAIPAWTAAADCAPGASWLLALTPSGCWISVRAYPCSGAAFALRGGRQQSRDRRSCACGSRTRQPR